MQITNLLLRDGRDCIDGVEPAIEGWCLLKLFEAGFCELCSVLNRRNLLDEASSHWKNFTVRITEIFNVDIEILFRIFISLCN